MSTAPLRGAALAVAALLLPPAAALAAGPEEVASVDRSLWPDPMDGPAAFDAASFAENVFFARAMVQEVEAFEKGTLSFGPKATHRDSVALWRDRTAARLARNLRLALAGCASASPICAGRAPPAPEKLGPEVGAAAEAIARSRPAWATAAERFYTVYAREQVRLAALFPAPTSEILPLSDREALGDRLPDRTFLLTFDDGPTPAGGETDRITAWLRAQGSSAVFFALDDALRARRAADGPGGIEALYAGQCLGSHGREHKAHPSLPNWRASIDQTRADVRAALPKAGPAVPFRPPYGQRSPEMVKALEAAGDPIVLWNIDSQDWNDKLAAERVSDRVFTLMLLWRSGIVLFHDVHPRALRALPAIATWARAGGASFQDCRQVGKD
jgi:peptidoglycan/xylan/chitin deacetylase (PgdA/CDA1 family)